MYTRVHARSAPFTPRRASLRATVCAALVAGASLPLMASSADPTSLNESDIASLVTGKRVSAERVAGGTVSLRFGTDGTLGWGDGHTFTKGTWSIAEGKLCISIPKWNYDGCGRVIQQENLIAHLYPAPDERQHLIFKR